MTVRLSIVSLDAVGVAHETHVEIPGSVQLFEVETGDRVLGVASFLCGTMGFVIEYPDGVDRVFRGVDCMACIAARVA